MRIKRCPECEAFFYATRSGEEYGSKACSKRCNDAIRMRKWRREQDRLASTAQEMKRKGEQLPEIARSLDVGIGRARSLIRKKSTLKKKEREL